MICPTPLLRARSSTASKSPRNDSCVRFAPMSINSMPRPATRKARLCDSALWRRKFTGDSLPRSHRIETRLVHGENRDAAESLCICAVGIGAGGCRVRHVYLRGGQPQRSVTLDAQRFPSYRCEWRARPATRASTVRQHGAARRCPREGPRGQRVQGLPAELPFLPVAHGYHRHALVAFGRSVRSRWQRRRLAGDRHDHHLARGLQQQPVLYLGDADAH